MSEDRLLKMNWQCVSCYGSCCCEVGVFVVCDERVFIETGLCAAVHQLDGCCIMFYDIV